eukprot:COSAG01_NODE_15847_length_1293_cov_1.105528_2_plen_92_part_00
MRVGNESFASQLFRHVKHIVDLDNAVMWVKPFKSRKVWQDVTAPTDVALTWAKFKFAGRWAIHFIIFRNMVYAVVGAAAEFPDVTLIAKLL